MHSGLLPLPKDERDYSYAKTFGGVVSLDVPDEYFIKPLAIKNQGDTDFCTAYAGTSVSEDQEGIELSGDWQMAKIKQLLGRWDGYGSDLRTAAKSFVEFGSLPRKSVPEKMEQQDRDYRANWKNWQPDLDEEAHTYRKEKFFAIDKLPGKDLFDSIRIAMWQNRMAKRTILTGTMWYEEWTNAPKGIVPYSYEKQSGLHASKIIGWKKIPVVAGGDLLEEIYLIGQNSYGTEVGDGGLFYYPREVVNKEFNQGLYMFRDLPEGVDPKPVGNPVKLLFFKLLKIF